ncbi:MAG: hypothetical protein N2C14_21090, partial [Planctomycetales bacterium]
MKRLGALVASALLAILGGDSLTANDFVVKYCADCHDNDVQEGQVNLVGLGKNLTTLFDAYDQVILEQMPPEDADQPPSEERAAFVKHLEGLLASKGFNRKTQPGYGNYVDH